MHWRSRTRHESRKAFSLPWRAPQRQIVRKVLCMRFLAHALTSLLRPHARNWCNEKSPLQRYMINMIISVCENILSLTAAITNYAVLGTCTHTYKLITKGEFSLQTRTFRKNSKIYHHSSKKHFNNNKTAKFGCEML